MTTGVLSDDMVMNGVVVKDLRTFQTADINAQMDSHSTGAARTTFYTQWALANSGFYHGKVDGIPGPTNAIFDAFVALYDSQYSGPDYARPANGHVTFKFYKAVMADQSSVDPTIYKVIS